MRTIIYTGEVTPLGMQNLQTLLLIAREEQESEIQIAFASRGGDVDAGIAAFNFIRMLEFPVHFHAIGNVASIAMTLMLAGKSRTASPFSRFCVHAARFSGGDHSGDINTSSTALIAQPFRDLLQWTDDEIATRFAGVDFDFSPEQAKQFRCIDSIEDRDFAHGSTVQVKIDP